MKKKYEKNFIFIILCGDEGFDSKYKSEPFVVFPQWKKRGNRINLHVTLLWIHSQLAPFNLKLALNISVLSRYT